MICKEKKILDFTPIDCWKMHFPKPEKYCLINKYKSKANSPPPAPPNFYIITTRISNMKILKKKPEFGKNYPEKSYVCFM